jgi:hypothetical protein
MNTEDKKQFAKILMIVASIGRALVLASSILIHYFYEI